MNAKTKPFAVTAKTLPLPEAKDRVEDRKMMCAEITTNLLRAVRSEQKRRGLTMRQVMEWSMRHFLAYSNPSLAKKLGFDRAS